MATKKTSTAAPAETDGLPLDDAAQAASAREADAAPAATDSDAGTPPADPAASEPPAEPPAAPKAKGKAKTGGKAKKDAEPAERPAVAAASGVGRFTVTAEGAKKKLGEAGSEIRLANSRAAVALDKGLIERV